MSNVLIACLSLLLVIAGPCGSRSQAPSQNRWSLELTTSGGFVGVGREKFSVNDQGKFECSETNRNVRKGLQGTLYPHSFQPINNAVAATHFDEWKNPEMNVAAADAFGYELELRTG